jgi:hypothetical protein
MGKDAGSTPAASNDEDSFFFLVGLFAYKISFSEQKRFARPDEIGKDQKGPYNIKLSIICGE